MPRLGVCAKISSMLLFAMYLLYYQVVAAGVESTCTNANRTESPHIAYILDVLVLLLALYVHCFTPSFRPTSRHSSLVLEEQKREQQREGGKRGTAKKKRVLTDSVSVLFSVCQRCLRSAASGQFPSLPPARFDCSPRPGSGLGL